MDEAWDESRLLAIARAISDLAGEAPVNRTR